MGGRDTGRRGEAEGEGVEGQEVKEKGQHAAYLNLRIPSAIAVDGCIMQDISNTLQNTASHSY